MIVGRKKEIAELKYIFNSTRPEFVALYGRRRVGKTYLIDQIYGPFMRFRHSGREPDPFLANVKDKMKTQLNAFLASLVREGMENPPKKLATWADAFLALERFLDSKDDGGRYVVFIDEMPWMDTPKSSFLAELGSFWNNYACRHDNMILVACGSASSWILDNLIHASKSLYGRVTHQMVLYPLSLGDARLLLQSNGCDWSDYDIAEAYMAVGGIPHYLSRFMPDSSVSQNVDRLFFGPNAYYKNEFSLVFSSQFTCPDQYRKIIETLGEHVIGLDYSSLSKLTNISSGGSLSKMLQALINGGFVIEHVPFGKTKREKFYKLIDPFCYFYLKQIRPNKEKAGYWLSIANSPKTNNWYGHAFEILCFNHIDQIKGRLSISGIESSVSMMDVKPVEETRGAQIDMILDRGDRIVNLCEMKFVQSFYTQSLQDHLELQRRKSVLASFIPKRSSVMNVLVTTYGLALGKYASDYPAVVVLEDLFR